MAEPSKIKQTESVSSADEKKPTGLGGIAAELQRARTRAGMNVSELHRRTGISRTVIQGYEAGKYGPGYRELKLLCDALVVTPTQLLYGTDQPFLARSPMHDLFGVDPDDLRLALFGQLIKILNRNEREAVITLVTGILEARHKDKYLELVTWIEACAKELQAQAPALGAAVDSVFSAEQLQSIAQRIGQSATKKVAKKKRGGRSA